ncbi:MAG TPA: ABC transporter substrate-binding protein [Gammaproteobacteria bacterium]|nr:ABC transporter substrate-binding protein [Gammaproteobacteria bacterium]
MQGKASFAAVLAAVMLFLVACSDRSNDSQSKVVLAQWGSEKYLIYLPVYIAQEEGFFKRRGLEVTIDFSGNDDQVFAKVLRGDAQFGVGDPIFTAVSRQQGADGVVLASIVDRVALWGVSKEAVTFTNESDFSGKNIGTFPRPSTTYTLLNDTIGRPTVKDARIVEAPIGNELPLLESGAADIVMMLEPAASIAESEGYFVVASFPKIWGRFAFTGLTSTEQYMSANRDKVSAMIAALQDAVELAHRDRARAVKIAESLFPTLDSSVIESAVNRMLDDETIPRSVALDRESWVASVRVRQRVGDVEEGFDCLECLYEGN